LLPYTSHDHIIIWLPYCIYTYMRACKCQLFTDEGSRRLPKRMHFCFSVLTIATDWLRWAYLATQVYPVHKWRKQWQYEREWEWKGWVGRYIQCAKRETQKWRYEMSCTYVQVNMSCTYRWICPVHTGEYVLYIQVNMSCTYRRICPVHTGEYALYIQVNMSCTYRWICPVHTGGTHLRMRESVVVLGDIYIFSISRYLRRVSWCTYVLMEPESFWIRVVLMHNIALYNTNENNLTNKESQHSNVVSLSVTLNVASCAQIHPRGCWWGENA